MNLADARKIADDLRSKIEEGCVPGMVDIVGSIRRKRMDVGDIEILGMPILKAPRPEFGQPAFTTIIDLLLYQLMKSGYLFSPIQNGPKKKKFPINVEKYGLRCLNQFNVEFYLCTPPGSVGRIVRDQDRAE